MLKVRLILLAFLFFSAILPFSLAEYRVYQYYVKNLDVKPANRRSYLVTSTLDPVSFLAYHGGRKSLGVDLLQTWMCLGSTAGKPICSSLQEIIDNGDGGKDIMPGK